MSKPDIHPDDSEDDNVECDFCYGQGIVRPDVGPDFDEPPEGDTCPQCGGTGKVESGE